MYVRYKRHRHLQRGWSTSIKLIETQQMRARNSLILALQCVT
nr:MAG TPA: hypothetical protein [Caudoviricetes sp.]